MTPAELDAVRDRAKAAAARFDYGRNSALAYDASARDVPTLLALVAELTRERDEARRQVDYAAGRLVDEAVLPGAIAAAEAKGRRWAIEALRALFGLYETWWHKIGTYDPGHELVSDGTVLTGISGLISTEDADAMEAAALAIEPHEAEIRALLAQPTTEETP